MADRLDTHRKSNAPADLGHRTDRRARIHVRGGSDLPPLEPLVSDMDLELDAVERIATDLNFHPSKPSNPNCFHCETKWLAKRAAAARDYLPQLG